MHTSIKSFLAAIVLTTGVSAMLPAAAAQPFIYKVHVKTSFGTSFTDCFTFQGGTLTIAGLGTLEYAAAPTTPKFYYSAVTTPAESKTLGYGFAFAGFKHGNATKGELHAVGSASNRVSYNVAGEIDTACAASDLAGHNAYQPAAAQ